MQAAHCEGQEGESEIVEIAYAGEVGLDPRRIVDEACDEHEGKDADGDIDEEDPAPGVVVGDEAAEGGSDGGCEDGDEAVEGKGLAAFLGFKGVGHDGLGHWLHSAAAESLHATADEQDGQRGGRSAEEAGDSEDDNAEQEEVFAAHDGGDPAAEWEDDGVGHQIAGEDPGALVGGGTEGARDVGQGDVGDGSVEHLHEGGEGDGHGDEPGVDAGLPVGVGVNVGVVDRDRGGGRQCL